MSSVRSRFALLIAFFLFLWASPSPSQAEMVHTSWYGTCRFGPQCVASRFYCRGTVLELVYQDRRARGVVRDYGPEAGTNVQLDVSEQIAELLGMKSAGKVFLIVIVIYEPKPHGHCR
jgi:hypothetical protein